MAQAANKPTTDDISEQLATLREDVAALTTTLRDLTRAEAQDAAKGAKRMAGKAREGVEHEYERLQKQAGDAVDHADALIREKPAMAMGIAAGVGLLVGLMLSRRS
ncbi:MAG: DUF883 family protein [Paracoccaceae bacterium]|uniref:DUF883 family protein n=1 Tax=Seohaeicola saemankumensis TaxID=481181 RepID=UPI001E5E8995|nr:DUF883 domain-containing protein [Seohaeicola saemankumensis]MCD1627593.1 DUF883 domain-containing protein [Seohaeicola saemankumensis]